MKILALEHELPNTMSEGFQQYAISEAKKVWDLVQEDKDPTDVQNKVNHQRHFLEKFSPIAPVLKGLLNKIHGLPQWSVRSPLEDASQNVVEEAAEEFLKI